MGAFSPSSKVKTQYKAVYIEKNVGTRSTRVLTHMVIKEVKSEVGRAKPFFHFTCPSDRYFADFGCPNTKSTRPKKKKAAKTDWLWLTKMSQRKQVDDEPSIPKNGCYSCHKQRQGMFLANCTKHVIFDLVKFNPGKFFTPCLLKSTDTRLFILLFFSYLKSYFPRLFETISYSFPNARFSRGRTNSSCSTFRTPRISNHF